MIDFQIFGAQKQKAALHPSSHYQTYRVNSPLHLKWAMSSFKWSWKVSRNMYQLFFHHVNILTRSSRMTSSNEHRPKTHTVLEMREHTHTHPLLHYYYFSQISVCITFYHVFVVFKARRLPQPHLKTFRTFKNINISLNLCRFLMQEWMNVALLISSVFSILSLGCCLWTVLYALHVGLLRGCRFLPTVQEHAGMWIGYVKQVCVLTLHKTKGHNTPSTRNSYLGTRDGLLIPEFSKWHQMNMAAHRMNEA